MQVMPGSERGGRKKEKDEGREERRKRGKEKLKRGEGGIGWMGRGREKKGGGRERGRERKGEREGGRERGREREKKGKRRQRGRRERERKGKVEGSKGTVKWKRGGQWGLGGGRGRNDGLRTERAEERREENRKGGFGTEGRQGETI